MFNTNAIKSVCVKKDSRKPVKSSVDTDRVYQAEFDYIITDNDSINNVENKILRELKSIDGISLEGNPGINNDSWTVHDYGLDTPENLEYFTDMPEDGLVHLYTFDFTIEKDFDSSSPDKLFNKIYNEFCSIDGIYVVNGIVGDNSWSKEEYGITSSRKPIKSGLLDETKGQQVEQFREEIRRDVDTALNEICYNYQEKLGITTGDSWEELDIDYVTENIINVLKDQLINFM